jgi:hypothetical protein
VDEKGCKVVKNILRKQFMPLDQINFECRFKKGQAQNNSYEVIKVKGMFKKSKNPCKPKRNAVFLMV